MIKFHTFLKQKAVLVHVIIDEIDEVNKKNIVRDQ